MLTNTHLVYVEINFREIYKQQPSFAEIFSFLVDKRFKFIRLYEQNFYGVELSHANGLL